MALMTYVVCCIASDSGSGIVLLIRSNLRLVQTTDRDSILTTLLEAGLFSFCPLSKHSLISF